MRLVPYFLRLTLGVAALGCSSSTTDTTTIVRPELVAVSPDDFLGAQTCGNAAGQVRSYVATLFDVTPDANGRQPRPGFQLPSSPPTSCEFPVTFSYVLTNHRYIAQVDEYDRTPQSDVPDAGTNGDSGAGGANSIDSNQIAPSAPGARLQVDRTGARVSPRWVATCGGFPPTPGDAGSYGGYGGNLSIDLADSAGAGGEEGLLGVLTYDGLTQTTHDCRPGLVFASN